MRHHTEPGLLTLSRRIDQAVQVHGLLALPWERRGDAPLLRMPHGSQLRHGDLLCGDDGRVVRVVAAPEPTYAVRCPDASTLARCATVHEELAPFEPGAGGN